MRARMHMHTHTHAASHAAPVLGLLRRAACLPGSLGGRHRANSSLQLLPPRPAAAAKTLQTLLENTSGTGDRDLLGCSFRTRT